MAYINSIGFISPQNTSDNGFACDISHEGEKTLRCVEPDYGKLINPVQLRRMSHILKLGIGAAQICLNGAGNVRPDAIVVGTGLACVIDLETFLVAVLEENGQRLSPIPFINSSHNTVASQIARILKNRSYNNTYCHRGSAFESALTDAVMLAGEGRSNVLVGGVDEISRQYVSLLNSMNIPVATGEGAGFFLVGDSPSAGSYARIGGVRTAFFPAPDLRQTGGFILDFLADSGLSLADIDTVVLGKNGYRADDMIYDCLAEELFPADRQLISYKHLCGEYMTSTAFALALSAHALKFGAFPKSCYAAGTEARKPQRILVFNHYLQKNYSLMIVER
ncbi:MAG: beta-ketoacyl synthase chain length factor [Tannerella sp.]|jgi:3-oxoacyl-(acyl-carrier-protein) synthase|nr:beta-ketoacyl synthase chain length factor [Tannerella sp.]